MINTFRRCASTNSSNTTSSSRGATAAGTDSADGDKGGDGIGVWLGRAGLVLQALFNQVSPNGQPVLVYDGSNKVSNQDYPHVLILGGLAILVPTLGIRL